MERVFDGFQSACLTIKISQIVLHEADQPDSVCDLLYSDVLPSEDGAEVYFLFIIADVPR